jgi:hypothetical protein
MFYSNTATGGHELCEIRSSDVGGDEGSSLLLANQEYDFGLGSGGKDCYICITSN